MIGLNKTHHGHILTLLPKIDDESVDCVVTSPPYYGLRSYKCEPQIWLNGNPDCGKHEWAEVHKKPTGGKNPIDRPANVGSNVYQNDMDVRGKGTYSDFCIHCRAWKGELGLEPTFELYLGHLFQIFDEIKRVLKKTGVCFVNLGDSYGGSGGSTGHTSETKNLGKKTFDYGAYPTYESTKQYQAKSLLQIPSRFSIGMTNRGWILRNRVEWFKRSCMPSSATDRFTVDYEDIFFFVKSQKYFFNQQFDKANYDGRKDTMFKGSAKYNDEEINPEGGVHTFAKQGHQRWNEIDGEKVRNKRTCWDLTKEEFLEWMGDVYDTYKFESVWDVVPEPLREAHFAVFPQALAKIMIDAGCPEGGIVLDPFMGSGTTAIVAKKLNRHYVGIELQEKYFEIQEKRFHKELGLFQ